jgi:DNA-binding Xre family transcriptional regulator
MGSWMAIKIEKAEMDAIAKRLESRMAEIEIDEEKLASILSVTKDTVYKLVRGETVKRWVYLTKVSQALQTSPNNLLGFGEQDRERLRKFLNASYRGLGLSPERAQNFVTIFFGALDKQPDPDEPLPEEELLRLSIKNAKP